MNQFDRDFWNRQEHDWSWRICLCRTTIWRNWWQKILLQVSERCRNKSMKIFANSIRACQHEVDAFERRLPTTNTESSSVVSDVSKETLAKLEDWNKLPLHATLLEALRQSRNIKAPTPVQVAMINSFGSTNGNILLQAPFGKHFSVLQDVVNWTLTIRSCRKNSGLCSASVEWSTASIPRETDTQGSTLRSLEANCLADPAHKCPSNTSKGHSRPASWSFDCQIEQDILYPSRPWRHQIRMPRSLWWYSLGPAAKRTNLWFTPHPGGNSGQTPPPHENQ